MSIKHPLINSGTGGSRKRKRLAGKDTDVPDKVTPASGESGAASMLKEESTDMEWERRLSEQEGERALLEVRVQEARKVQEPEIGDQQDQLGPEGHPNLMSQLFDGADLDMTIDPSRLEDLPPEIRMEVENQLRLQHQQKLQNQQQLQQSSTPTPHPGGR